MKPVGGLKLALEAAGRHDRRARFAAVFVGQAGGQDETRLVADSRGRLRYRLAPGEYQVRAEEGGETRFVVRDRGWTPVRIILPGAAGMAMLFLAS